MKNSYAAAAFLAIATFIPAAAHAQIDMAAIAQFKYNQQQAMAQSLAKNRPAAKNSRPKGSAPVITLTDKPAIIHAHNPKFKTIPGDAHKSNVR